MDTSTEYLLAGQRISKEFNNLYSECAFIINLGENYYYNCDYITSLKYFEEALEKSLKIDMHRYIFYCYIFSAHGNGAVTRKDKKKSSDLPVEGIYLTPNSNVCGNDCVKKLKKSWLTLKKDGILTSQTLTNKFSNNNNSENCN